MDTAEHTEESIILMVILESYGFEFVPFENPNFEPNS